MLTHFWHLVQRAFALVLAWNSATTFSLVKEAIFAPLIIFVFAWYFEFRGDWKNWAAIQTRAHDILKPFLFSIVGSFALIGIVFAFAVPFAVYQDHEDLVSANKRLRTENSKLVDPKSRDEEIVGLKAQLGEARNEIAKLKRLASPKTTPLLPNALGESSPIPSGTQVEILKQQLSIGAGNVVSIVAVGNSTATAAAQALAKAFSGWSVVASTIGTLNVTTANGRIGFKDGIYIVADKPTNPLLHVITSAFETAQRPLLRSEVLHPHGATVTLYVIYGNPGS